MQLKREVLECIHRSVEEGKRESERIDQLRREETSRWYGNLRVFAMGLLLFGMLAAGCALVREKWRAESDTPPVASEPDWDASIFDGCPTCGMG